MRELLKSLVWAAVAVAGFAAALVALALSVWLSAALVVASVVSGFVADADWTNYRSYRSSAYQNGA